MPTQYRAVGYESLTVSDTAGGLTGGVTGTQSFVGRLETAQIRYRTDGTDPTSGEGVLMNVGDQIVLSYSEIKAASFIRTGDTSGVLKGHFYNIEATVFSGAGS